MIVRGPLFAGVYTLPGFRRVASFPLPRAAAGGGISVGPTGLVRVSTEGARSAIRQVALPASVTAALEPPATTRSVGQPDAHSVAEPRAPHRPPMPRPPRPSDDSSSENGLGSIDPPWLMWCIPAVIAVGALGIGLGLRRRTE